MGVHILNLLLAAFILFMVYWWSSEGLFSALIHLLLTVFAALLAVAVWEPVTQGLLVGWMPEYAWGVGLLAPFAVILFGLRVLFDKAVLGNLHINEALSRIGGGLCGLGSGVLTAGMLVIGLGFTGGLTSHIGYEGYAVGEDQRPEHASPLMLPVDALTARFLGELGAGAWGPIGGGPSMPQIHPDLAAEASLFAQAPFSGTRRGMRPEDVSIPGEDGYFRLSEMPAKIRENLPDSAPAGETAIVTTEIAAQGGVTDAEGIFRIGRPQIALICEDTQGAGRVIHPIGYIQRGAVAPLLNSGQYAYSRPSVQTTTHRWIFRLDPDLTPKHLWIKRVRLSLPEAPITDLAQANALVTYEEEDEGLLAEGGSEDGDGRAEIGDRTGLPGGAVGDVATVSNELPFRLNINGLSGFRVNEDNQIIRGEGRVLSSDARDRNIVVDTIAHPRSAAIVQVDLGRNRSDSLLGQIFNFATQNTQAPLLVDDEGQNYQPMGYAIVRSGDMLLRIEPSRPIRALSQLDLGQAGSDDQVILYYQVPTDIRLTRLNFGQQSQDLDLYVPAGD